MRAKKGEPIALVNALLATNEDGCISWPYAVRGDYGIFHPKRGKSVSVHRYVCEAKHGKAPTLQHHAAHLCGRRYCVNPKHIVWSTPSENMTDRYFHGTNKLSRRKWKREAAERRIALRLPLHDGDGT